MDSQREVKRAHRKLRTLLLGAHATTTHLTPLPALLVDVLRYLHLPLTLYTDLRDISTFDISIFGK
jgi:hypothetical protein